MGGGKPLDEACKARLPQGLRSMPGAFSLLAQVNGESVGFCNCFTGYSTFYGAPLINIHDIAVEARWRGRGIGQVLMRGIEAEARKRDCCKITLEVVQGNLGARAVYKKAGFVQAGMLRADSEPAADTQAISDTAHLDKYDFWQKVLD